MVRIEQLTVDGQAVQGVGVMRPGGEGHPNLLMLLCKRGYIMCGYLNQSTAEAVGDAAAVVSGSDFEELLKNSVKTVTPEAEQLGVTIGMTGAEAVSKLNR